MSQSLLRPLFRVTICLAIAASVGTISQALADEFLLAGGGRIVGELMNPDQSPRETYVVKTSLGGQVVLAKDRVSEVLAKSKLERFYEQHLPSVPNTVDGHWDMAEKCGKVNLKRQQTFHLEQVLKIDPEHSGARYALGFSKVDDRWVKTDEFMASRGYVRHRGAWRLPQEIAINERKDERDTEVKQWREKLKMWRTWIIKQRGREAEGWASIQAIDTQRAAPALVDMLENENEPPVLKKLYIDTLGKLQSQVAVSGFIDRALNDPNSNIRDLCLDYLDKFGREAAARRFIKELENKENVIVNRAAFGLGRLKYEEATLELIEALATKHRKTIKGSGGNLSASFGSNGVNSFGAGGGGPKTIEYLQTNDDALRALATMHPGENYQFDKEKWTAWYVASRTPQGLSLRRPIP